MMSILFPHLIEDIEYLLPPPEREENMASASAPNPDAQFNRLDGGHDRTGGEGDSSSGDTVSRRPREQTNAEAGPSSLGTH
jgi:hypothetical protein